MTPELIVIIAVVVTLAWLTLDIHFTAWDEARFQNEIYMGARHRDRLAARYTRAEPLD